MGENEFLVKFIQVIQKHGCTIEDILSVDYEEMMK